MESLEKQMQKLKQERNNQYHIIQQLDTKIDSLQKQIYMKCKADNGDHDWVRERESGPYGERYSYCKKCRFGL